MTTNERKKLWKQKKGTVHPESPSSLDLERSDSINSKTSSGDGKGYIDQSIEIKSPANSSFFYMRRGDNLDETTMSKYSGRAFHNYVPSLGTPEKTNRTIEKSRFLRKLRHNNKVFLISFYSVIIICAVVTLITFAVGGVISWSDGSKAFSAQSDERFVNIIRPLRVYNEIGVSSASFLNEYLHKKTYNSSTDLDMNEAEEMFILYLKSLHNSNVYKASFVNKNGIEEINIKFNETNEKYEASRLYKNQSNTTPFIEYKAGLSDNTFLFSQIHVFVENDEIKDPFVPTISVQKSVKSNTTNETIGYVIVNVNIADYINELDYSSIPILIVSESGNFLYNKYDRTREWEVDRGVSYGESFFFQFGFSEVMKKMKAFPALPQNSKYRMCETFCTFNLGGNVYFYEKTGTPRETILIFLGYNYLSVFWNGNLVYIFCCGLLVLFVFLFCVSYSVWQRRVIKDYHNYCVRVRIEHAKKKQKLNTILDSLLPSGVVHRYLQEDSIIIDRFDNLCIMFADLVGFTSWYDSQKPKELIKFLRNVFISIDCVLDNSSIFKIKTIGDCYMACCGLNDTFLKNNSLNISKTIVYDMKKKKKKKDLNTSSLSIIDENGNESNTTIMFKACLKLLNFNFQLMKLRVGINTGKCLAGVIDNNSVRYDIWGTTVNLASRLEQSGVPSMIHLSNESYNDLSDECKDSYIMKKRTIHLKGFENDVQTYLCDGRTDGEDLEVPSPILSLEDEKELKKKN